ncbi:MAG: serine hydrolase domain-containing protein [Bacillota bacterium]|nr:serine hydrolase domain-containing protein [Bacillota bacterium]
MGIRNPQVDAIFAEWAKPRSPGVALAVIHDGALVYEQGYGSADLEHDIPITPSSIFHVASVSKQFTAMSIMLLAAEGRLSLDDDVLEYLPFVPDFGHVIRVRHLIHHTSGLRDQWQLMRLSGVRMDDVITQQHIVKAVARQRELNFAPGDDHLYCNTGYTLLAEIVTKVSGQPFVDFTRDHIFTLLGMQDTHFHLDHEEIVKNLAYSYAPHLAGGFKKKVLSFANVGATSLFTTARDLFRWMLNFETHSVGGAAAMDLMHRQCVLNSGKTIDYAGGLSVGQYKGLRTVGHGGSDAGYRSYCGRFPDQRLGIAVLGNLSSLRCQELAQKVAEVYLADQMVEPAAAPAQAKPWLPLPALAGAYFLSDAGIMITVHDKNGRLLAHVESEPDSELVRTGPLGFLYAPLGVTLQFTVDDTGVVAGFSVPSLGYSAVRLNPQTIDRQALADYTGRYFSPELDTTYTVSVAGSGLVLQHWRLDDAPLVFVGDDRFVARRSDSPELRFERREGRVVGFRVMAGRVRNLGFGRVG